MNGLSVGPFIAYPLKRPCFKGLPSVLQSDTKHLKRSDRLVITMWFKGPLHPVLARYLTRRQIRRCNGWQERIPEGLIALNYKGKFSDLIELIDSANDPNTRMDNQCFNTLYESLTTSNTYSEDVIFAFKNIIRRHNRKQSQPLPPVGYSPEEKQWQKIEKVVIAGLGVKHQWITVIAEMPGPRKKCENAINAIVHQNQIKEIDEYLTKNICTAIINHCESNACALLEEHLLSKSDSTGDDNEYAKSLAEIGYWRHVTLLQQSGANALAEKLRFRLIANGSSYLESIHNSEFKEEQINREIMALQNEELRAEKMQQTSLQAQLTGHIRALSSRVDSLEKKGEESSPQTVVNVMNVDVRDSVVMGNIEQSTIKDSMFDLDDLDL